MKVCLISDIHFGVKKNSDRFVQSQLKFLEEIFIPYLKNNGIDTIFFLGDLFDNRNSINVRVKNSVLELFEMLKKFKVYLIVGNHDCYYNTTTEVNSLKIFEKFKNVNVIEKMTDLKLEGKDITMIPWIVDAEEFEKEFQKKSGDVVLGHLDIAGFNMNKVNKSVDGMSGNMFTKKFKKVFSGHFHIRGKHKYSGTEIVYIGSPYQLNRGDAGERRGFVILDLKTLDYEYVDNEVSIEYVKLKFPQKFTEKIIRGNVVDVHIEFDSYNENKLEKYINKVESFEPAVAPRVYIDNKNERKYSVDLDDCEIGSVVDLMREYVNEMDIGNKDDIYNRLVVLYGKSKGDE